MSYVLFSPLLSSSSLDSLSFWFELGRRLIQPSSSQSEATIPTDSVESYEVMRRLDYDIGIPAEEFLELFHVCRQCGHVLTRYWAEDHPGVCPAR